MMVGKPIFQRITGGSLGEGMQGGGANPDQPVIPGRWRRIPITTMVAPPGDSGAPTRSLPIETRRPPDPGDSNNSTSTGTPPAQPAGGSTGGVSQGGSTPQNTGGAGLAGNGPLIDALTQALMGGGMQNPLDAVSSPSTAALEALQPTQGQSSTSSNPALVAIVLGAAAIGGVYLYAHRKKKPDAK